MRGDFGALPTLSTLAQTRAESPIQARHRPASNALTRLTRPLSVTSPAAGGVVPQTGIKGVPAPTRRSASVVEHTAGSTAPPLMPTEPRGERAQQDNNNTETSSSSSLNQHHAPSSSPHSHQLQLPVTWMPKNGLKQDPPEHQTTASPRMHPWGGPAPKSPVTSSED